MLKKPGIFKTTLLLLLTFFIAHITMAATTGKIRGKVTDADTGVPLPGVNVTVVGTEIGGATDTDGTYFLLNVPPGTYTLRFNYIGYAEKRVTNVRVEVDLTTNINAELSQEALQGQSVTVVAEQPVVKQDVAASQRSITSGDVESLPVQSVGQVLGLQAGVTNDLSVRGSGSNETLFMVDGITLRDNRDSEPVTTIPLSALSDASIQTGGFGAEYSNVRGGVVNVVMREGGTSRYSGTITYKYHPASPKHFGISPYDPNSYWLRPYMDPEVAFKGTDQWDEYTQRQYVSFRGWNQVSRELVTDDNPNNDLTPEQAKRVFEWQHRRHGYIQQPDVNIDGGFGGPVPFVSDKLGNLRFYASYRKNAEAYLINLSRNALTNETSMLKLTSDISDNTKLNLIGIYGQTFGVAAGGGQMMSPVWDVASGIATYSFTVPTRIFSDAYWSQGSKYFHTAALKLTRTLGQNAFYTLQLREEGSKYHMVPGPDRSPKLVKELFPGYYVTEAPFGFVGDSIDYSIDGGIILGGALSGTRDHSKWSTYTGNFDLVNQINDNNEIKTGVKVEYHQYNLNFGTASIFPESNTTVIVDQNPYLLNAYFQDKLEYQGFIATVGLIADYRNPNGKWFDVSGPYSAQFYGQNYNPSEESQFKTEKLKSDLTFSPRLAISHPITENSKLYFNYGHYRQVPISERLYRVQRRPSGQLNYIGNPELPMAKTISYELGYDHALTNSVLLHLAAYYKDISDQESWIYYQDARGQVNYRTLQAQSYADIRGLEIDVTKRFGRWWNGLINYEYRVSTSGYFGVLQHYENPQDQRNYLQQQPPQNKPIPRPRAKFNLNFHMPKEYNDQLLIGGWVASLTGEWISGSWMTWNPNNLRNVTQNIQRRDWYGMNLQFAKYFPVGPFNLKLFADIQNLFNFKQMSWVSFQDIYDTNNYMKSLHLPTSDVDNLGEYGNIPGNDTPGDYRAAGVEFQPIEKTQDYGAIDNPSTRAIYYNAPTKEYVRYSPESGWSEVPGGEMQDILDNKAYIDMPNFSYATFLSPRSIFFGITLNYRF